MSNVVSGTVIILIGMYLACAVGSYEVYSECIGKSVYSSTDLDILDSEILTVVGVESGTEIESIAVNIVFNKIILYDSCLCGSHLGSANCSESIGICLTPEDLTLDVSGIGGAFILVNADIIAFTILPPYLSTCCNCGCISLGRHESEKTVNLFCGNEIGCNNENVCRILGVVCNVKLVVFVVVEACIGTESYNAVYLLEIDTVNRIIGGNGSYIERTGSFVELIISSTVDKRGVGCHSVALSNVLSEYGSGAYGNRSFLVAVSVGESLVVGNAAYRNSCGGYSFKLNSVISVKLGCVTKGIYLYVVISSISVIAGLSVALLVIVGACNRSAGYTGGSESLERRRVNRNLRNESEALFGRIEGRRGIELGISILVSDLKEERIRIRLDLDTVNVNLSVHREPCERCRSEQGCRDEQKAYSQRQLSCFDFHNKCPLLNEIL